LAALALSATVVASFPRPSGKIPECPLCRSDRLGVSGQVVAGALAELAVDHPAAARGGPGRYSGGVDLSGGQWQLMTARGLYAELFTLQARAYH
jgi:hypothetical protein